ncbi:hypothetical protein [Hymenobacter sp. BT730]|uniref:hypothetical protein n=1 Tax=Hymenobacter sp. BT730 TaxID=3063332 RepID=UPI0026E0F96C|nr:hypothetical protein [Hymenobacter sp. BT730]
MRQPALSAMPPIPPVVLGVDLRIEHQEDLRRSIRSAFGINTRAIRLRIDPSLDLIYLSEVQLPGSLACLESLTRPEVVAVMLRKASMEWHPEEGQTTSRGTPTLAALETGNCFLTANNHKIHIASFTNHSANPNRITMELLGRPNLLEYLRAEWFTLEISGTNRRRLVRPLGFSVRLEFDVVTQQAIAA